MKPISYQKLEEVLEQYGFHADVSDLSPFGNGHINDTFLLKELNGNAYIVQRINTNVFSRPTELMENMAKITDYLAKKIAEDTTTSQKPLTLKSTKNGQKYYEDSDGNFWRVTPYLENTVSYQLAESAEMFKESARAFGEFQRLLSDFPANTLYETIPNFHHTPLRVQQLEQAVNEDKMHRAKDVAKDIAFALSRKDFATLLVDKLLDGSLPLRVTHNDTKLNNVLMDQDTGKAVCVVDLDTVMPGLSLYDYGDSIRFGASTASEDEQDLSKVEMSLSLFRAYTEGYLESAGQTLTSEEIRLMPVGAKMMTLECGMRFLADYLNGDTYFKIHYPTQNLDRARTQFKLVADMEEKWDEMNKIVQSFLA